MILYGSYCYSINKIKQIFNIMENNYYELNNNEEHKIMKHYIDIGAHLIKFLAICLILCFFLSMLVILYPMVFNVILPLNESRKFIVLCDLYYFVDPQEYAIIFLLYTFVLIFILCTIIGTQFTTIIFVQHCCGFFKVASYRLEHAMDTYKAQNEIEIYYIICAKLIKAIEIYKLAIKFFKYAVDIYKIPYTMTIFLYVLDVSVQLYYVVYMLQQLQSIHKLCINVILLIGKFCFLFLVTYLGQNIENHSSEVFEKCYDSLWYTAPVATRRLLLIIMINIMKPCQYEMFGGLFKGNIEGFSKIIRVCISYFMSIYSIQ
ncbi:odorant receptor 47a-like isoform X2 [Apis florea]|uniref:odorant receptor 47a-like isoform X2 n=1 Tax=Apis florea TaxID=7463 RepID=UPI0012FE9587|nr:odorant receptor 47a-like isoform X2 [Apis florea]